MNLCVLMSSWLYVVQIVFEIFYNFGRVSSDVNLKTFMLFSFVFVVESANENESLFSNKSKKGDHDFIMIVSCRCRVTATDGGMCCFRYFLTIYSKCTNLQNVDIPPSVRMYDKEEEDIMECGAFYDCPNLNEQSLQRIANCFIDNFTLRKTFRMGISPTRGFQGSIQKGHSWSWNVRNNVRAASGFTSW